MRDLSVADDYLEFLVRRQFAFKESWKNLPVAKKLRHLENLNAEVYRAYKRREVNGGIPIPEGWQRWARAQETLKK